MEQVWYKGQRHLAGLHTYEHDKRYETRDGPYPPGLSFPIHNAPIAPMSLLPCEYHLKAKSLKRPVNALLAMFPVDKLCRDVSLDRLYSYICAPQNILLILHTFSIF